MFIELKKMSDEVPIGVQNQLQKENSSRDKIFLNMYKMCIKKETFKNRQNRYIMKYYSAMSVLLIFVENVKFSVLLKKP